MTWFEQAACRGLDPALFFIPRGHSPKEAKAVCATCPVTAECLAYALTLREGLSAVDGVWGATTERERRLIKRGRPKSATPWYERDPALAQLAIDMRAAGATTAEIAARIGVGKQAIYNWRTRMRLQTGQVA